MFAVLLIAVSISIACATNHTLPANKGSASEVCVSADSSEPFVKVENTGNFKGKTFLVQRNKQKCIDLVLEIDAREGDEIDIYIERKKVSTIDFKDDAEPIAFKCAADGNCVISEEGAGNAMDSIFQTNFAEGSTGKFSGKLPIDFTIFEGDILVDQKMKKRIDDMKKGRSGDKFDAQYRGKWPKKGGYAIVPYTFNRRFSYAGRSVVKQAIDEYKRKTCVRFVPRTNQRNYVEFFHGGGCYSYIGSRGGRQQISLNARGCLNKGTAIHEMMHLIGFFHEQSRRDRDRYIRIYWNNIIPRTKFNFEMYRSGQAATLGEPYDKKSVMHYPNNAFSRNGRATIVSVANPRERLGQRRGFSIIDMKQINKHYQCSGSGGGRKKGGGKRPTGKRPPPKRACLDGYPFCPDVSRIWCSNSWVKSNCKKSCKLCTVTNCPDKNKSCPRWKIYCNQNKYKPYMRLNCKKTCGFC